MITPANRPALAQDPDEKTNPFMFRLDLLQSDRSATPTSRSRSSLPKRSKPQPKARRCLPRYEVEPPRSGSSADSFVPRRLASAIRRRSRAATSRRLAASTRKIAETYETSPQYHNPMEPHAIVAAWDGDTLSIDTPSQVLR